jgi:hypothetical protein
MKRFPIFGSYLTIIYWITIVILFSLLTLFITLNISWIIQNWGTVLSAIVTIIGAYFTLMDTSRKFYRFIYKTKAILLNRRVSWSLNAVFKSEKLNHFTFNKLKDRLRDLGERRDIFVETDYDFAIQIDGLNIKCNLSFIDNDDIFSESDVVGKLNILIPDYQAPYVETNLLLQNEVIPILGEITNIVGYSDSDFNFDVIFKDKHPFIGMYVKNISKNNIVAFSCEYKEPSTVKGVKDNSFISVGKQSLSFHTKDIHSLGKAIDKHLFLSG